MLRALQGRGARFLARQAAPTTELNPLDMDHRGLGVEKIALGHGSEHEKQKVFVEGYNNTGFVIKKTAVLGSVALLSKAAFHWSARTPEDITWESLSLFRLVHPKPRVLLVGTGDTTVHLPYELRQRLQDEEGITLECMGTRAAIGTFNIMNDEDRSVALALVAIEPEELAENAPSQNPPLTN